MHLINAIYSVNLEYATLFIYGVLFLFLWLILGIIIDNYNFNCGKQLKLVNRNSNKC